jgi:hypothetical protein
MTNGSFYSWGSDELGKRCPLRVLLSPLTTTMMAAPSVRFELQLRDVFTLVEEFLLSHGLVASARAVELESGCRVSEVNEVRATASARLGARVCARVRMRAPSD